MMRGHVGWNTHALPRKKKKERGGSNRRFT